MQRPGFRIGQVIARSARLYGEMPCLVDVAGTGRSFAEVDDRVNRLASSLAARGVAKDTRVAALSAACFEYVELLLACLKLGATFIPLNSELTVPQADVLVRHADPDFLFVSEDHVDTGRLLAADRSAPPQLLSLDGTLGDDLGDLIVQGDRAEVHTSLDEDDILLIVFADEETGRPRGTLQSHRMLKGSTLHHREYLPRPGETRYTSWPLYRASGLVAVLTNLAVGCASVIAPSAEPSLINSCIESGLVTGCFLPAATIATLLDLESDAGAAQLRVVIYQGLPLRPDELRRALRRWPDCDFWYLYGTDSGVQTCLRPEDHRRGLAGEEHLLRTVGQPVLGADVRLLDDDGREVSTGTAGHVAVQTDILMSGYLDDQERTSRVLRDGWFLTGDIGQFDHRSYLSLVRRNGQAAAD